MRDFTFRIPKNKAGWRSWPLVAAMLAGFLPWEPLPVAQAQQGGEHPALNTNTISLPSGPGSIEGLGESFEPQLNTGSYVFRLPFRLPKVRGQAQPSVSMTYNSGSGNGPLGLGWSLRVPSIQRQTDKGLPMYDASDHFITGDGEELTARVDGTYRRKVETDFTKWENPGADGWRGTARDGTVMRYGATAQARQERAAGQTFRWMLESAEDTNGNRVEYIYVKDSGQIYLSEIRYGMHASQASEFFRVSFAYDGARPDALADYRGRFKAVTAWRLRGVTVFFGERRVRHWKLDYHEDRPLTQLAKFTVYGDERAKTGADAVVNVDFLPPVEFEYSTAALGDAFSFNEPGPPVSVSLGNGEARLTDLNRDGLPDLLLYENRKYSSMVNRGPGRAFGSLTPFATSAFYPDLHDPATRLADLRGDGTLKVLVDDGSGVYYREFTSATTLGPPVPFALPGNFPLGDGAAVQTVDIDNSRAMDFMTVDGGRFSFILSGGGDKPNRYAESPPTPVAASVGFADGWQLSDMNGDRMPDLAVIDTVQGGGVVFYPGKGLGEFDPAVTMPGGPVETDLGSRGRSGLSLVDVDGDGLADLVLVDSGVVKIWPNLSGRDWGGKKEIAVPQVPDWNEGSTAVQFLDMNGNGSTDIVWNDPSHGIFLKYLDLQPHTKPNVMTRMKNGMGRVLNIEYRSSVDYMLAAEAEGSPWTARPPFSIPVVSAFTESDGMGSTYRTELTYRNGYYDGPEREFRGFERAIQTEIGNDNQGAPSLVSEFQFDTGATVEALKGVVRGTEVRDTTGRIFRRLENQWNARPVPGTPAAADGRAAIFAFQESETTTVIEKGNGAPVTLFKEFSYDDFGNQTRLADYGRVQGADRLFGNDERVVARTFSSAFPSGLQRWILSLPVDESTADGNGIVKAKSEMFYDDEAFAGSNRGLVANGNLTLRRDAVDVAADKWIKAARNRYDAFGNITRVWDPLGDPGNESAGHFRILTWDTDLHTYPEGEQIGLGATGAVPRLTTAASYDKGLGVMTSSVDFNGNRSTYRYDPFARLAAIIKPGDTEAAPTESYEFSLGMTLPAGRTLNWITSHKRETAGGGTVDARMFFDGLGRKVMMRSEGETSTQTVVTDTVVFNDRKTEWKRYLPYFDTDGLGWKEPTFQTAHVQNTYDATGRLLSALNPPETTGGPRKSTRTEFAPLRTVLYDEEDNDPASPHAGTPHTQYQDGLGRLIGVDERKGAEIWPTRYNYDVLDNLTGITDSQGNAKSLQYDGLKRLTGMNDPDRGVMSYTYDDASNLTDTTDARGQHIGMTYDGANRIRAEFYGTTTGRAPEVAYFYDTPFTVPAGDGGVATGGGTLGKLSQVTDLSGGEILSYDARGRMAWRIKRIPDPLTGAAASFRTGFAYDSMDRLTRQSYPDGDHADHGYNARGLPANIIRGPTGAIISHIGYIPTGQLESCLYGNGITTSYHYDPRQRLNALMTIGQQTLIDFSYTFDGASNITRIDDNRAGIPAADPRRNTQVFAYDDLYRITKVQYTATAGEIAYAYDRIGNMLSQISNIAHVENGLSVTQLGTMSYGGTAGASGRQGRDGGQPGPHALTGVSEGGRNYPYDENGNMRVIDGLACTWDFKDRLTAVENAEMRAEYTYDYTDRRIIKKVFPKINGVTSAKPDTTLYVDRFFEIRGDGAPVKYIWNGDTRVARVTANLNATQRVQQFALQPGWNIVALAVTLTDGPAQLLAAPVQQVYRQGPGLGVYSLIQSGETLPAGTILRVQASTAGNLAVRGAWTAPPAVNYPAGRQWIANSRFEPLDVAARLPADAPLWFFDAATQDWRHRFPAPFASAGDHPSRLAPGEATFAVTAAPFTLTAPDPTLEIRYYHQDHLGSSSVMSDVTGQPVSESAYYPFGHPRQENHKNELKEIYGFTQKEKDKESELSYFEARFQNSTLGRFASADPFKSVNVSKFVSSPQDLNLYNYVRNMPICYKDPTGLLEISEQQSLIENILNSGTEELRKSIDFTAKANFSEKTANTKYSFDSKGEYSVELSTGAVKGKLTLGGDGVQGSGRYGPLGYDTKEGAFVEVKVGGGVKIKDMPAYVEVGAKITSGKGEVASKTSIGVQFELGPAKAEASVKLNNERAKNAVGGTFYQLMQGVVREFFNQNGMEGLSQYAQ